jgi:hypothetical protein
MRLERELAPALTQVMEIELELMPELELGLVLLPH